MTWLERLKNLDCSSGVLTEPTKGRPAPLLSVLAVPARAISKKTARPILHFRPSGTAGNAWATLLGWPGESREELIAYLHDRWPDAQVRE